MPLPPLVTYQTPQEYREHFGRVYCAGAVVTFDGISVTFARSMFDHCFFESSRRDSMKDSFSTLRAERIDWIRYALQDPNAPVFSGWDNKKRRNDPSRRVTLHDGCYVTVIAISRDLKRARFVTHYVMDAGSVPKLMTQPTWPQK